MMLLFLVLVPIATPTSVTSLDRLPQAEYYRYLLLLALAPILELAPAHTSSNRRNRSAQEPGTPRLVRRHARDTGTGKPTQQTAITLGARLSGIPGLLLAVRALLLLPAVRTAVLLLVVPAMLRVLLLLVREVLLVLRWAATAVRPVLLLLPLVSVLSVALVVGRRPARVVRLLGRVLLLLSVRGPVARRRASAVALVRRGWAAEATLVLAGGRGRAVTLLGRGLVATVLLR